MSPKFNYEKEAPSSLFGQLGAFKPDSAHPIRIKRLSIKQAACSIFV